MARYEIKNRKIMASQLGFKIQSTSRGEEQTLIDSKSIVCTIQCLNSASSFSLAFSSLALFSKLGALDNCAHLYYLPGDQHRYRSYLFRGHVMQNSFCAKFYQMCI